MAEAPDQMPAAGLGHLRASHADREQVIGTLKTAFVQGMLAKDEFDLRLSQTFTSLAAVTADLPTGLTAANPLQPARIQCSQPAMRPGRWIAVATALYAGSWAYELFLSPHGGDNPSTPPLIFGGFFVYLIVWIFAVGEMVVSRMEKRSSGQLPRPPAPGARPTADPGIRGLAPHDVTR